MALRQFKGTYGVSFEEFDVILSEFGPLVEAAKKEAVAQKWQDKQRIRKEGGGNKEKLPTSAHKLCFVLYYLKNYPTFDTFGTVFGMSSGHANKCLHLYWPFLVKTLDQLDVLPKDSFESLEEFQGYLKQHQIDKILVDATERLIERPKNNQKEFYSGKKKRHTVKNTILSSLSKFVLFIGQTLAGRNHDLTLFRTDFPKEENWFELVQLFVDLGYLGLGNDYKAVEIHIPYKKPYKTKNNPESTLTEEQKQHNKKVSQTRILVEHAIGGIKRFQCLVVRCRTKKQEFRNQMIFLAAGIWNLHLCLKTSN